jgi:hypothetical protein
VNSSNAQKSAPCWHMSEPAAGPPDPDPPVSLAPPSTFADTARIRAGEDAGMGPEDTRSEPLPRKRPSWPLGSAPCHS